MSGCLLACCSSVVVGRRSSGSQSLVDVVTVLEIEKRTRTTRENNYSCFFWNLYSMDIETEMDDQ